MCQLIPKKGPQKNLCELLELCYMSGQVIFERLSTSLIFVEQQTFFINVFWQLRNPEETM